MDYNVQGNKVVIKASSTAFPGKEMEYSFTFGEPFDNMGMDGSPFKVSIEFTGDGCWDCDIHVFARGVAPSARRLC